MVTELFENNFRSEQDARKLNRREDRLLGIKLSDAKAGLRAQRSVEIGLVKREQEIVRRELERMRGTQNRLIYPGVSKRTAGHYYGGNYRKASITGPQKSYNYGGYLPSIQPIAKRTWRRTQRLSELDTDDAKEVAGEVDMMLNGINKHSALASKKRLRRGHPDQLFLHGTELSSVRDTILKRLGNSSRTPDFGLTRIRKITPVGHISRVAHANIGDEPKMDAETKFAENYIDTVSKSKMAESSSTVGGSDSRQSFSGDSRDQLKGWSTSRLDKYHADGGLRTIHSLPDFQASYDDAKGARYLRCKNKEFDRELSIATIFNKHK